MYKGFLLSNAISLINFNLYLAFASVASDIELGSDFKNYINGDTIAAVSALLLVHPLDTLKYLFFNEEKLFNLIIYHHLQFLLMLVQQSIL